MNSSGKKRIGSKVARIPKNGVLKDKYKPIFTKAPTNFVDKFDVQNSTDWVVYRKRHNLDSKVKIFICKGYGSFKKALIERGWHENTEFNSHIFHLKFTVKRDSIFRPSA